MNPPPPDAAADPLADKFPRPMSRSLSRRLHVQRPFYARLRGWLASEPRSPSHAAFTAGELRDAAAAIEDSGLLSRLSAAEQEAERLREAARSSLDALECLTAGDMWEQVEGMVSGPDCPDGHNDPLIWLGAEDPAEIASLALDRLRSALSSSQGGQA